MNNETFSRNLRRLRLQKGLTQERLAGILGVSVQSVSRWECGNTLPDVMLLPELAKLYAVTVDDLYRETYRAYPSYAQRLLAVYEASGRTEDFLAAELEFARMSVEELTADDLRAWGVLYHYMMKRCASEAGKKLDLAMRHPEALEQVSGSAAQQKILLLVDQGRGQEEIARYERMIAEEPGVHRSWLLCTSAYEYSGNYEKALDTALRGIGQFPDSPSLRIHAGDICRALKRYEEAFGHWKRALELDRTYLDAVYSMGFCHEEMGNFREAHRVWTELTRELDRRGLVIEREYPASRAADCVGKME